MILDWSTTLATQLYKKHIFLDFLTHDPDYDQKEYIFYSGEWSKALSAFNAETTDKSLQMKD